MLRLGPGRNIIVLNSPEAVNELLTKRAVRYSSRPYSYVAHEIVSEKQRILLLPYEEPYKVRICHGARMGVYSSEEADVV